MHIEVHIFPDHFPINQTGWAIEMADLGERIHELIIDASLNQNAYALGKTTLLANDDSGMVVATIDIRRE
jgi:hypothetical protein